MTTHNDAQPAKRTPLFTYLIMLGLGTALLYSMALLRFPLLAIYSRPIQNLDKLTGSSKGTGLVLFGCIGLLFVAYGLGALAVARYGRRGRLLIIAFPLLFAAILFWTYSVTSIDIYDYLFRGRMLVRYHANTFVTIPLNYEADPLFNYIAWRRAVTAYGPIWEWMSWITARLAGEGPNATALAGTDGLFPLFIAYKAMAVLGFLLCGAALWLALGHVAPQQRWLGLYLWLWNPLALWESVAAGHNDAWMALLIVLALWAFSPRHDDTMARWHDGRTGILYSVIVSLLGLLALTVGGLIKYLAFCFGPVLLLAGLRRLTTWRARLLLLLLTGLTCSGLVVAFYARFWVGWDTLRNFSDRGALFTATWLAALQALLTGPMTKAAAQHLATSLGLGLFATGIVWASIRAWLRPDAVAQHVLGLLLWFLFVCSPWFQPWYLLWALAVVALQPWNTRLVWTVGVFCCTALLSYVAGSFLLPALGWDGRSAAWNALLSTLIYVPPLLAMLWGYRARGGALLQRARRVPRLSARRDHETVAQ